MSESREKKRRYNLKLKYIAQVERWLEEEPPIYMFIAWIQWKKGFPRWEMLEDD